VGVRVLLVLAVVGGAAALVVTRTGDGSAGAAQSSCGAVRLEPAQLGDEATRRLVLCLLNAERERRGLAPLGRREQLELASQRHSEDMVARRFFEHDTPEGTDPQARMLAAGYPSNNAYTGENIAWAGGKRASPWEIVDLWMHSPPHRENVLSPGYTEIGIGLARGAPEPQRSDGVPWTYTTDFGGPPLR
jgi:uncharacterized protein YkwD